MPYEGSEQQSSDLSLIEKARGYAAAQGFTWEAVEAWVRQRLGVRQNWRDERWHKVREHDNAWRAQQEARRLEVVAAYPPLPAAALEPSPTPPPVAITSPIPRPSGPLSEAFIKWGYIVTHPTNDAACEVRFLVRAGGEKNRLAQLLSEAGFPATVPGRGRLVVKGRAAVEKMRQLWRGRV